MNKSNFYKKAIISITGATLLSACLNQTSIKFLNNTSTEVRAAKKVKKAKITGANSAVYRQKNKKMVKTKKTIILGKKVRVSGQKTYKGKLYYKIGKNQYIKAANVDGKPRKVAKTTVLYTRNGKAIKNTKIIKGQKIKVYGAIVIIKGQKYYSTLFGYIKANTLAKKKPVVNPNGNNGNTQKPENNKPGNTNPSDNTNKPMTPTTPGSNNPTYPSAELQAAQAAAVKAVQEAAQNAKNAITASSSMTDDEKTAANGRVDTAAKTALGNDQDGKSGAIHDATTTEAVNQAKTDALTTINAEESNAKAKDLQAAQAAAVKAVQEAAQNAKNAITASSSMTDDEKTAANGRVDTAAKTALGNDQDGKSGAIHDATTTEAVNQAKTDALTTINAEESNAKARK